MTADTAVGAEEPKGATLGDDEDSQTGQLSSATGGPVQSSDSGETSAADEPLRATARIRRLSTFQWATVLGLMLLLVTGGLAGWLGFRADQAHQGFDQRQLYLQVGRQAALNLTTMDAANADGDVQRVLDSATGQFYDDFSRRPPGFIQLLKQTHTKSAGTIAEAGLESVDADAAQVLVAVRVTTTNAGVPDQRPRSWRMRISVQSVEGGPKVSNVEFVP